MAKAHCRIEHAESAVRNWLNEAKKWRSHEWKNLKSLGESLQQNPVELDDVTLTAEMIDINEKDPITALYSLRLLKSVKRIIGSEAVR